ncbi:MAG: hypothetical protein LQ342_001659 [Letrouitia transgressa]|nr:MAG: hypothetical protein LQ342_001659 [Letrouitia transgressa]
MPNFKFKTPSRNWLIFLSVTSSFTAAVLYDRFHKRRAQQRWCNIVSHIAQEPLPTNQMPRKITVFLSPPPGDSLRAAREHFHEYIKPVLVAGAMDWDVVEGRKEGDVRASYAERIRKTRRKKEEKSGLSAESPDEDQIELLRGKVGTKEWEGAQGDLVLGRNTWKEYLQGLHEGWLGPLNPPPPALEASESILAPNPSPQEGDSNANSPDQTDPPRPEPEKSLPPSQLPPYISPSAYNTCALPPSIPESFSPSLSLPFPHLLGFLNTPFRIYRLLNRRYLADETGQKVAALVLASSTRSYHNGFNVSSSASEDGSPSRHGESFVGVDRQQKREQEDILKDEEKDWHKSAWKGDEEGEGKRVWRDKVVIDGRLAERMSTFELTREEEERAKADDGREKNGQSLLKKLKVWVEWEEETGVKGWEDGLVDGNGQ